jgi:hypothetical protein
LLLWASTRETSDSGAERLARQSILGAVKYARAGFVIT